jgi:hypothetical protein
METYFAKRIEARCQHTHEDDTGPSECAIGCGRLIKESSSDDEGEDLEDKYDKVVLYQVHPLLIEKSSSQAGNGLEVSSETVAASTPRLDPRTQGCRVLPLRLHHFYQEAQLF